MNPLVSLFLCMTSIYIIYSAISYKVVLSFMGDMFLCSSSAHDLEACALREHDPLILLHMFVSSCICLYD
jgi:hypothetical protein